MTDFYKELKSIRVEKDIELEGIHKRTKISLSALRAIEKGMFDQLPHTYVRLFLRAYAVEVGVDPEEVLNKLEIYLGNKALPAKKKEKPQLEIEKKDSANLKSNVKPKKKSASKRSSVSVRTDITKSFFIILTLLFALYIILSINKDTASLDPNSYQSEYEEEGPISNQMLKESYIKTSENKQALKGEAPFSITLTTDQRLWYEIKTDELLSSEQVLPAGDNHLHRFEEIINIKFNQTLGLNLYLNGNSLSSINTSIYPIILSISVPEKTVTVQQFSLKK